MDGYVRASGDIFAAIDPSLRAFRTDTSRLKGDRRIIGAVKAFWAFLADEHTPNGIATVPEKKDGVMRRLRARGGLRGLRYLGSLLGRRPGLLGEGPIALEVGAEKQRACQAN
jgi:hypothetical protein